MTTDNARRVFSQLMQLSQRRKLTEKEKEALSRARQQLRMARRPAMNAKRKYGPKGRMSRRDQKQKAVSRDYHYKQFKKGERVYWTSDRKQHGTITHVDAYKASVKWDDGDHSYMPFDSIRKVQATPKGKLPNPQRKAVVLYGRLLQIKAEKSADSQFPGQRFYHNFKPGAVVYGLPNGDLLIRKQK